jgi:hypothetical protein
MILRDDEESDDHIRPLILIRIANATAALVAAFDAASYTDDVDERSLRFADVSFSAARGHDELHATLVRLYEESGEHPELEQLKLACGLFAAAQACATFATGAEVIDPGSPAYIEHTGSYRIGLEWIVRLLAQFGP